MAPSLFVSVGDPSGERALEPVLRRVRTEGIRTAGLFGRLTEKLMDEPVADLETINATGLLEVLPKLPSVWRTKKKVENHLKEKRPDLLLLVDAPGFNLPLLKKARGLGVPKVAYFILPQVWAWKEGRKKVLEEEADLLLSVLPFERRYYSPKRGRFVFVGHPSVERLEPVLSEDPSKVRSRVGLKEDYFVVFLGSRANEVKRHLPVFEKALPAAVKEFGLRPVVLAFRRFKPLVRRLRPTARIVYLDENPDLGYRLIRGARFGWIKSGTTAFEAALLDLPHLTFYRLSRPTYWLAKRLVKVPFVHLANLVLEERAVPELLQEELTVSNLLEETYRLLGNADHQRDNFRILRKLLRPEGKRTSQRVAEELLNLLKG
ncbi:MAG: hypothetical protein GXO08_05535 [Aquificae bacterium]|nr:hypothetical protein [Aquificota bacterium]